MLDGSMWRAITVKLMYQIKQANKMFIRVFTQIFGGGGDLLSGTICGPHWRQSQMGRTQVGDKLDEGIRKIAKNAPYSKIRVNFGVLSIKYNFLM